MSEPSLNSTSSAGCLIGSRESVDLELGFIKLESIRGLLHAKHKLLYLGTDQVGKRKTCLSFTLNLDF